MSVIEDLAMSEEEVDKKIDKAFNELGRELHGSLLVVDDISSIPPKSKRRSSNGKTLKELTEAIRPTLVDYAE